MQGDGDGDGDGDADDDDDDDRDGGDDGDDEPALPCREDTRESVYRSCNELHSEDPDERDGLYPIDPDGPGAGVAPFCAYCLMSEQGGGWTLFAHHADGINTKRTPEILPHNEFGVLTAERWRAVRDTMSEGMLFIDENDKVSRIRKDKLQAGNCLKLGDVDDLVTPTEFGGVPAFLLWHDETSGCVRTGSDYGSIQLAGAEYASNGASGASLYQQSHVKFDVWPYDSDTSFSEQNVLWYYVK